MTISHYTATRLAIAAIVVYAVGFLHQYGWHYNRPPTCPYSTERSCDLDRASNAFFRASFWPITAPLDFAVWATKP